MNHAILKWVSRPILLGVLTFFALPLALASELSDISGHDYEDTIQMLVDEGVISGYPDGTYQPDREVNRVEFLKIVMGSTFDDIDSSATDDTCGFSDTVSGQWYIPYLCRAVEEGVVQGYSDGTFKPEQTVNFVEAAKIASLAHGESLTEDGDTWYENFVIYLSENLLIPSDVESFDAELKRGQVAELLGRYLLLEEDGLASYLEEHDFDYVLYSDDFNALSTSEHDAISVSDYIGALAVLTFEKLFENSIEWIEDDWSFTAETGDSTGIFTDWSYSGDGAPSVDVTTGEEGTSVSISNTSDYLLSLTAFLNGTFGEESTAELGDDADFSGTLSLADDEFTYDWFEDRSGGDGNFEDDFSWIDLDTDSYYERSITDGIAEESFYLTTPEVESGDEDLSLFAQQFTFDETIGAYDTWTWGSSDGEVFVNQAMYSDYYTEYLSFSDSDQANLTLEYEQENVTESFDFESEDGAYVLNMDMANNDFDETMTYLSDNMDIDMTLTDMNDLGGTAIISDESGESVSMTLNDSVLNEFIILVADGDDTVEVTYLDYGDDYTVLDGTLTTEEGTFSLFTDGGMLEHGIEFSSDEIFVNESAVILSSELIDLTFDADDDELEVEWGHSTMDEVDSGNLLFNGLLSDFNWDLNLGDEDAYDAALKSDDSFSWHKNFGLGLDPYRLIRGNQDGGVKGKGVDKKWDFQFDSESAELNQDLEIEKEGFGKRSKATITLVDNMLEQQMELNGQIKGVDVNAESNTKVENGELEGDVKIDVDSENLDGEFDLNFGSGKDIEFTGGIIFTPPSLPGWVGKVDIEGKGNDITVKPELSIPVVDNGNVKVNLGIGGEFDSNGEAQGNINVDIHIDDPGIDINFDGSLGEGGEFDGGVQVNVGFSF